MSLEKYFDSLITKVEQSNISNAGKDENGFFKPTRTVLIQNLNILRDLHTKQNPYAKSMLKKAWAAVVETVPPEWLMMTPQEKEEMKKILE